jgi:hypothetical protein
MMIHVSLATDPTGKRHKSQYNRTKRDKNDGVGAIAEIACDFSE